MKSGLDNWLRNSVELLYDQKSTASFEKKRLTLRDYIIEFDKNSDNLTNSNIVNFKFMLFSKFLENEEMLDEEIEDGLCSESSLYQMIAVLCAAFAWQLKVEKMETWIKSDHYAKRPKANNTILFFMVRAIAFTGNQDAYAVLMKHIYYVQYHMVSPLVVYKAAQILGLDLNDDSRKWSNSISVRLDKESNNLYVNDDLKFTGSSNCIVCRFFPCSINEYYKGSIQDCKLFGKTNPNGRKIIDFSSFNQRVVETESIRAKPIDPTTISQIKNKHFHLAIPSLCQLITTTHHFDHLVAWYLLGKIFFELNEIMWSFVAFSEANFRLAALDSNSTMKIVIKKIVNDPGNFFQATINYEYDIGLSHTAMNYDPEDNPMLVHDLHLAMLIRGDLSSQYHWINLAKVLCLLGESDFAELCHQQAIKSAIPSSKKNLTENYLKYRTAIKENIGFNAEFRNMNRNTNPLWVRSLLSWPYFPDANHPFVV